MPAPSVAIVILNWNGKYFLQQFLPSVVASLYENFSIVIADNASDDDSILFLKENYPQIRLICNSENKGFAEGYNLALNQISAEYYILLNSDVEVTENWIGPVISRMESDKEIAACQPKILSFKNKDQFEYAGACGGWIDKYGYPFTRGRIFDFCERDDGQYDEAAEIFWATGAALFVRSSVFNEVHGFDEYFFAHQEEIDLCWRMKRNGYKIFVEPASVVYHIGGGTLPMGNKRKVFLNFRNNMILLAKNSRLSESIWKIPFRIVMDNVAAVRALVKKDTPTFSAIESAHFQFIKWIFIKKERDRLPKKKLVKMIGVYKGSLVWQFFVNKKRTFYQIVSAKK
jgi:GT2 family glycosyltransferase